MSAAICFNLELSKYLSSGNELSDVSMAVVGVGGRGERRGHGTAQTTKLNLKLHRWWHLF